MIGEYSCPYLCNTGKACGNACIRPEGCRFHWKAKKRFYDRLRSESLRLEIQERLRSEIREKTYEEIMLAHRDTLAILNITLCKECLLPIKIDEREYCNSCQSE
ncbi:hypothetical protein RhiirA4_478891 [Rhizophagus irregularis]|uniref:Uncharacterized protein n=1 Tax=Rhizophagus irregularis TaxID=588596 RepID=A0A2I1HFL2_9GLOM|nr:hypothetical protein RhiirA4_478891 [Rhizophagus irregularis]